MKNEITKEMLDDIVSYAEDNPMLAEDIEIKLIEMVISNTWNNHRKDYNVDIEYKNLNKTYKLYLVSSLINHYIEYYESMLEEFKHSL